MCLYRLKNHKQASGKDYGLYRRFGVTVTQDKYFERKVSVMSNKVFGYIRISSSTQNLARQREQMKEYISDERYIVEDEASGKKFDRKGFNSLVGTEESAPLLGAGDLLIITSLDRLGRNYVEIREQWTHITQTLGADIKVLEMPLLDTSSDIGNLDRKFIADLALQILSYVAEKERINIKARQRQGIDVMPVVDGKRVSTKTGRPTGRPNAKFPKKWDEVYKRWLAGEITAVASMAELKLKKATFYSLVKRYEAQNHGNTADIVLQIDTPAPACGDDICADVGYCSNCKFANFSSVTKMFRCRNRESKLFMEFVGDSHSCILHEFPDADTSHECS